MKRWCKFLLLGLILTLLAGGAVPGPVYAADTIILKVPVMLVNLPQEAMSNNMVILCGNLQDQNGKYIPNTAVTAEIKTNNGNYSGIVALKFNIADRSLAKSYQVFLTYAGTCFDPGLAKANVGKYMDPAKSVVCIEGNLQ